ncbi:hypothetical protein SAMN05216326_11947 [Nitrosomonas marina]|uniref:Integrase DNA-binding domain-containing protein n=1 Tax=Nitrosomonas marina TaxID=917 RepID=A0A1I0DCW3_9PROT|nr:Arm DNA-binding domain-containing protein [Nitrosomonas marina]SET29954.1 hypothetical protein SAMN05216326_11947 [Nitrosomonas marina]
MNYRFAGKQKTLAFGLYPDVSLKEARKKRVEAKSHLAKNVHAWAASTAHSIKCYLEKDFFRGEL